MKLLKELNIIIEAPERIDDIYIRRLDNPRENSKYTKEILNWTKNVKIIETTDKGIELHQIIDSNKTKIYGIDPIEKRIVYFVKYQVQKADFVDVPWVTQVMVWSGTSPKARGLAEYMFFKYLLPLKGVVVTDIQQTRYGERFWKLIIGKVFTDSKYKVYIIDFNKKTIVRYKKLADFEKLLDTKNDPWKFNAYNRGIRPAIADFDLIQE